MEYLNFESITVLTILKDNLGFLLGGLISITAIIKNLI